MFNFLDSKLLPKILLKPLATDSYEADNLISTDFSSKARGFIAYPSIKPPVELEFEFLCEVNIAYIVLNTSVGNHRCSGIELFAKNSTGEYCSIARAVYEAPIVIFCNKRDYSMSNPPPCRFSKSTTELNFLKGCAFKFFLNAAGLKIVIFRTQRSVPCLASVEVWGKPARSCSQKTVDTVQRLVIEKISAVEPVEAETVQFKIPGEFKDDLTYQLMTIPYTLPSGKTVDYTTLEKHVESEKSFGRKPGDPFTGIKFTETLKPVLNVALKSRIDMFLLRNSHATETFNLKRTLGLGNAPKRLKGPISSDERELNGASTEVDILIQKAKTDPNFTSFSSSNECTEKHCAFCKKTFQSLYELPCKHFYCRKCLLSICADCVCMECKIVFTKRDVNKIDL
ncbi:RING finger protein 37 [Dendroctonus ponderosae]|uniref:RING-type domain-containing protein n=1 Tax=Dendroctonus ponderosae TaxID=77166 RepID=A0AAR5PRD8_DENPD|nr:RING finger protein 37 [Dendroctonus ponderosae]KAH1005040.1 hypothetical protein HUJ04_006111 [Dendroctonus ponderosae]KAH1012146.1 hypothetical protein HUJ05_011356 [Dendroctonus ponderosae]